MLRLALVVCLLAGSPASAWASRCPQHYAGGKPPVIVKPAFERASREVCFRAFAVMHSGISRTPLWSAEHLERRDVAAAKKLVRRDAFHAEPALPAGHRAELDDYARTGYDRGHLAPSADMPSRAAQRESFSLANMVPQVRANNAGIWADIESAVRQLAVRDGELYVVTGPAFLGAEVKRLKGRVLVPTHLWKVVYSPRREQAGAYLVANDETRVYTALPVTELERRIGLQLLPGVAQRTRDTPMALPRPDSRPGGPPAAREARDNGKDDKTAPGGASPAEYGLRDLARRGLERILRQLTQ